MRPARSVPTVHASGGLHPAVAEVRRSVRGVLERMPPGSIVLIAVSGGADSIALAAATAFEAPKLGLQAVSVTVDHGLQDDSTEIAAQAARATQAMGLAARVVAADVGSGGGPEAAARQARYRALAGAAAEAGASSVLLGHTLDDQAETVLLGLARGSGPSSLQGMAPARSDSDGTVWLRPLLGVRRTTTRAACTAQGLTPWDDPHNIDPRFARVRVRERVLPMLETELGPNLAEALVRTAEQLREDADAFTNMIDEMFDELVEHGERGLSVSVAALAANPAALRNRLIRRVVAAEFRQNLTRTQTLEVARLVTDWVGQGPIDLPGCHALRIGGRIEFTGRP